MRQDGGGASGECCRELDMSAEHVPAGFFLTFVLAACAGQEPTDPPAVLDLAPGDCARLLSRPPAADVVLGSAVDVAAGTNGNVSYPAHCLVNGHIAEREGIDGKRYAIGFELRLPLAGYVGRF